MLKIAFDPIYCHPLPSNHRFPMEKYLLIPEQLTYEGTIQEQNLFTPQPITEEQVLYVHSKEYWEKLKNQQLSISEVRRIGFPQSLQLIERECRINGGTIQCCDYALKFGVSMNVSGGTHHAFYDHGEGFCLLNDVAIAAEYLLRHNKANKILVIDLDVHQGNGTAQLFKDNSAVFTFSMHGKDNYPLFKEQSDLDIPLPSFMDDEGYLNLLKNNLPYLFEQVQPDFVFYVAGVDVLSSDKLGKLSLSLNGCSQRDHYVLNLCKENKIPVCVVMGGGYSYVLRDIIEAHCNTFRIAQYLYF